MLSVCGEGRSLAAVVILVRSYARDGPLVSFLTAKNNATLTQPRAAEGRRPKADVRYQTSARRYNNSSTPRGRGPSRTGPPVSECAPRWFTQRGIVERVSSRVASRNRPQDSLSATTSRKHRILETSRLAAFRAVRFTLPGHLSKNCARQSLAPEVGENLSVRQALPHGQRQAADRASLQVNYSQKKSRSKAIPLAWRRYEDLHNEGGG